MRSHFHRTLVSIVGISAIALLSSSCMNRSYNNSAKKSALDYGSLDSEYINMDWRTAEDDPNAAVPAQRQAPNVLVEAISKAWSVANNLLVTDFNIIVTGQTLSSLSVGGYGSSSPLTSGAYGLRLLNLHLVHSSSIRLSADGSVSLLKPKSEQPTSRGMLDLAFQTVGDAKSVDVVAYFDFLDKTTNQWYRQNYALKRPVEFWNLGISAKAGVEITPAAIAGAILKAPPAVSRALGSIVDQLGTANFHAGFAGQRQWVAQDVMKRRLKNNDGIEREVNELAYAIARDVMQPVCREAFKRGNTQVKSEADCELRYSRDSVVVSPSQQAQDMRTMDIAGCRDTNTRKNAQRISYLYSLAPLPETGKPDFLVSNQEIKTYVFESEKGQTKPWRRRSWLTLVSANLPPEDASTWCGTIPEGKRCIVSELGESLVGTTTCDLLKNPERKVDLTLSLSDVSTMSRDETALFMPE